MQFSIDDGRPLASHLESEQSHGLVVLHALEGEGPAPAADLDLHGRAGALGKKTLEVETGVERPGQVRRVGIGIPRAQSSSRKLWRRGHRGDGAMRRLRGRCQHLFDPIGPRSPYFVDPVVHSSGNREEPRSYRVTGETYTRGGLRCACYS